MNRPLDGVRVVAVEQAVAVPFATRHLADMGADVIKVERCGTGDFARHYDEAVNGGLATHFAWLNRSKQSIALDLQDHRGAEILEDLLAGADVFMHNLGPGAMARLGFAAERLRRMFPRLIIAELTGYGAAGPMRDRKAYDLLVQAEAGLVSITGSADAPAKCGIPIADIAAGTYLVQGTLAALLARATDGAGDYLQVSLFDALVEWMGYPLYRQLYQGDPPPRVGLAHPTVVPYDAYPTQDGVDVLIGVQNDRGWRALVTEVLELPHLASDERTETNVARCRHRDLVDSTLSAKTATMSAHELTGRLDKAGIPNGLVNDVNGVVEHPQLEHRGRWTQVGSPVGHIKAVLPPVISQRSEPRMEPIPALGENTDAILTQLGYEAATRADLREQGVVA
jgi:itaconate CoA-transferase